MTWEEQAAPEFAPYIDCGFGDADPKNVRTKLETFVTGDVVNRISVDEEQAAGRR